MKTKKIETVEFGLKTIQRHDYDNKHDEISGYIKKSADHFKSFLTNIPGWGNGTKGTFLDIGCADHQALDMFSDQFHCKGIDLHPISNDVRIQKGDFYNLSDVFGENSVDAIFCNHTLEHSLAPLLLNQIDKVHKIGGAIFIAVPDVDYPWAYSINSSTTHWSVFNAEFLRALVTRYGYECHVEKKKFREDKGELFLTGIKRWKV